VLRAKLEVTSILRTDRYGPDGDPLYVVNNQPITRIKVPEALIRKQQTIRKDTRPKGLYGQSILESPLDPIVNLQESLDRPRIQLSR